eukprot:scaffold483963_cov44-Prasinocladus_malaysianus.AAC.1
MPGGCVVNHLEQEIEVGHPGEHLVEKDRQESEYVVLGGLDAVACILLIGALEPAIQLYPPLRDREPVRPALVLRANNSAGHVIEKGQEYINRTAGVGGISYPEGFESCRGLPESRGGGSLQRLHALADLSLNLCVCLSESIAIR